MRGRGVYVRVKSKEEGKPSRCRTGGSACERFADALGGRDFDETMACCLDGGFGAGWLSKALHSDQEVHSSD